MNKTITCMMSFALLFSSAVACAEGSDVNNNMSGKPSQNLALSNTDFTVKRHQQSISLGERWNDGVESKTGKSQADDFVGTVDYGDDIYKFYRHQYDGFDVYTSNLCWDKTERTVDDYIIAQITLRSSALKTSRGAFVGISVSQLRALYGTGVETESNGAERIHYLFGKKRISFKIADNKVTAIILSYSKED